MVLRSLNVERNYDMVTTLEKFIKVIMILTIRVLQEINMEYLLKNCNPKNQLNFHKKMTIYKDKHFFAQNQWLQLIKNQDIQIKINLQHNTGQVF